MNGTWYKYIIASAVLLALAMTCCPLSPLAIAIFLVPLVYLLIQSERFSFKTGYVWGLCYFSIHLWALALVLLEQAQGFLRLLAYCFLVAYLSCYSGLWHWLTQQLLRLCSPVSLWLRLCIFGATTILFFHTLFYEAFFLFGSRTGYCFGSPVVPLCWFDSFFIQQLARSPLLALSVIILINYMIALVYYYNKSVTHVLLVLLIIAGVILIPPVSVLDTKIKIVMDTIGYCKPSSENYSWETVRMLVTGLQSLFEHHPQLQIAVMPESSLPIIINKYPEVIDCLEYNALYNEKTLVVGTFRQEGDKIYNSILFAKTNCIRRYYDKNNPLPFTEYLPWPWNKIGWIQNLFLNGKEQVCGGATSYGRPARQTTTKSSYQLTENLKITPFICSDLLFNTHQKGSGDDSVVLFIVKDSWFCSYYAQLMYAYAKMLSVRWNQTFIYVSYHGAYLMSPQKRTFQLLQ